MMLKLMDGSYVNTAHVSRFFVTEDFALTKFVIKVSISGPQMPFTVSTYNDAAAAHDALDQMVYRIENAVLEGNVIGLQSMVCLPLNTTLMAIGVGQRRSTSAHRLP
jgi:hypothetical protein